MTERTPLAIAAAAASSALLTRWPLRSHELFSWDSANFALATEHIDIAAHRPHPPGYLGYVFAARLLNALLHDVNLSLILWNIFATAVAMVAIVFFARAASPNERIATRAAAASVLILLTSPLLWFYGEVGEIYVSEMLVVLLVAFCSWHAARTNRGWLWCGAAMGCAVLFKLSSAVLAVPCVVYGLAQLSARGRRRAAILVLVLGASGLVILLASAPALPSIVWRQFVSTTADSRLVGSSGATSTAFNRNIRDTLIAFLAMLGVGSLPGLIIWLVCDRRLPGAISWGFAIAWSVPWLLLVTVIHIAKPGYILPLLPLAALILGGFYARQSVPIMMLFLGLQAVANTAQFGLLRPFSDGMTGGTRPYHDKSFAQRMASDLGPITFPTLATIRRSDAAIESLRETIEQTCPLGQPTIVADGSGTDWRRVMWYFPLAKAIRRDGGHFVSLAVREEVVPVSDDLAFPTSCPVIWLAQDAPSPGLKIVRRR